VHLDAQRAIVIHGAAQVLVAAKENFSGVVGEVELGPARRPRSARARPRPAPGARRRTRSEFIDQDGGPEPPADEGQEAARVCSQVRAVDSISTVIGQCVRIAALGAKDVLPRTAGNAWRVLNLW
jgi:hypothetical protein